jgi:hypothetical protein
MRLIIIPDDGFVSVDGERFSGLDLSFMDSDIHAVQWYETEGEIERRDDRGRILENEHITSIAQFQQVLDVWTVAKQQAEQAQAALQAQRLQALQEQGAN